MTDKYVTEVFFPGDPGYEKAKAERLEWEKAHPDEAEAIRRERAKLHRRPEDADPKE